MFFVEKVGGNLVICKLPGVGPARAGPGCGLFFWTKMFDATVFDWDFFSGKMLVRQSFCTNMFYKNLARTICTLLYQSWLIRIICTAKIFGHTILLAQVRVEHVVGK